MASKKQKFIEHYFNIRCYLDSYVDISVLPSLEDLKRMDVIHLLNLFFPKGKEDEYRHTIYIFISEKEMVISDDHLPIVYNSIIDFVNFQNNI
jgi:hypothetical protein